jgi:6-phosphogluconolactonase (cycloisomerase 2 family)
MYEAIQAYRKDHKELPNWLSDLTPKYLADSSVLICPFTTRTGHTQTYGLSDPKINTSYAYEFSAQEIPVSRWGGGSKLSMRQFKSLQMALLGGDTPILRCYHHSPKLSMGFNGKFYESESVWEKRFAPMIPLQELSPNSLAARFHVAQKETAAALGQLEFVDSITNKALRQVTAIVVSPDGKHAYAAAYGAHSVTAFERDQTDGQLNLIQTLTDPNDFQCSVSIELNSDGRYAVVSSFQAQTVALLERDAATGKLKLLDIAHEGNGGVEGLKWVIHAVFSPDSQHVYATAPASAAVTAFQITEQKKLQFLQANYGEHGCFNDVRGITISPDGGSIYVASGAASTLVVLDRDPTTGKTTVKQTIQGQEGDVRGLLGVGHITCSGDGAFIYGSAGRFSGEHAICIFKKNPDKTLSLVKQIFDGDEGLTGFKGGNKLLDSICMCSDRFRVQWLPSNAIPRPAG